jgi:hypothetical protein
MFYVMFSLVLMVAVAVFFKKGEKCEPVLTLESLTTKLTREKKIASFFSGC